MNIFSQNNIALLHDPRSSMIITYLPFADSAILMSDNEIKELEKQLTYEQYTYNTFTENRVQIVLSKLYSRTRIMHKTKHSVEGIKSLMILPNNKCNFHCSYCYSAGGRTNEEISPKMLEVGLEYFLNLMRAKGERLSITILGGGEPLLSWKMLMPILERTISQIKQHQISCPISLVTNGSICTDEIIHFCKSHNISLSVSFDILEDVQNKQRECWEKVSKNINRFIEAGLDVALNTVISNDNVRRMTEMIDHLVIFHPMVKKVSFKTLITKHFFQNSEERRNYYQQFVVEFFKAKEKADRYGIWLTCSYMNTCLSIVDRYCPGKFVITSEGEISTCHIVGSKRDELYDRFVFGHIDKSNGKVYIDESRLKDILSYDVYRNENCQDCPARWHCAGGCYADHYHLSQEEHEAYCDSMRLFLASYLIYKYKL